jgi:hypothetical protein
MLLVLVLLLPSSCKQLKMLVEEPTALDVYWMSFLFDDFPFGYRWHGGIPLTILCPFRDDTCAFNERHDHVLRRRPPVTAALGG